MFKRKEIEDKDVLQFFKIVGRHHKANRTISDSVMEYRKVTDNKAMQALCVKLSQSLEEGMDLAPALAQYPEVFSPFIVEFIAVGEQTNQIDAFLTKIVDRIKQDMAIKKKISSATLMPKISMVILFCAFLFGVYYLVPRIAKALESVHVELPLITKLTLSASNLFVIYWPILPAIIFLGIMWFRNYKKTHPIEYSLLAQRIPFYKTLAYARIQYDFCSIFALCTSSGVRSDESLKYTAMAIDNKYMNVMLLQAVEFMREGMTITDAIRKADAEKMINPGVLTMLETGIETSKLKEAVVDEAEHWLTDLEDIMETIGDKISSAVLVPCYAFILLFFAIIEYPIMTLSQNLGNISRGGM